MKHYKYLFAKMLDLKLIKKAYKKLRRGKTKRTDIQYIDAHLDRQSAIMMVRLSNTHPGAEHPEFAFKGTKSHKMKTIMEHGKIRKIYMPRIIEQWVHHIIVMVLEPIIMKGMHRGTCGSVPKRGSHYGKMLIESAIRKGKHVRNYAQLDIRHYYDSIRMDFVKRFLEQMIEDVWMVYVVMLCFYGFEKGLPLGFYISTWIANWILEPLDNIITELGITDHYRYMDDMLMFNENKRRLHSAVEVVKQFLGRTYRMRIKGNYKVAKFEYTKRNGKTVGSAVDILGFVFHRSRTTLRKKILGNITQEAKKIERRKSEGLRIQEKDARAMLSGMGYISETDTYGYYERNIKDRINVKQLKRIVSKADRKANRYDRLDRGKVQFAA